MSRNKPMMWIACDYLIHDHLKNREQFNGTEPAWGESEEDFRAKQGVDVPQVGDELFLRMGRRWVRDRRLLEVENSWYWEIFVSEVPR